jgi:7-carboxy-7-deazaguanine synthase
MIKAVNLYFIKGQEIKLRENNLSINSIYKATEGEGINIGRPQIFIRFQGCNVGCLNCDSKDTWSFEESPQYTWTMSKVLEEVWKLSAQGNIRWVSITGGDPLHPKNVPHVERLISELKEKSFYINLEAAGTRTVPSIFEKVDYISFDYKTPSTGVVTDSKLIEKMVNLYEGFFQLKSVIESKEDFDNVQKTYNSLKEKLGTLSFPWILTPSFNLGESFPKERFQDILHWNESSGALFRVIGQQHKWIFGSSAKNV